MPFSLSTSARTGPLRTVQRSSSSLWRPDSSVHSAVLDVPTRVSSSPRGRDAVDLLCLEAAASTRPPAATLLVLVSAQPRPVPWCPAAGGGASERQAPPPSRCHGSRREGADLGTPPPARRLRALSAGAPAGSPVPVTGFETSSATRERAPDRNAGRQGQRGPALRLRRGA